MTVAEYAIPKDKLATAGSTRFEATQSRPAITLLAVPVVLVVGFLIAGICGDVGTVFANTHAPEVRHSIGNVAAQLFQPRFRVKSPPAIEVALRAKEGKTYLHLINCAGMQVAGDYAVIDSIPAIGPIRIEGARKATGVVEAQSVRKEADGAFVLPFVAFHTVLEVE